VDAATGARDALAYALYHPAAALRSTEVERQSYADVAGIPAALIEARRRRAATAAAVPGPAVPGPAATLDPPSEASSAASTLF
jgi:hypothetical protein